MFVLAVIEDKLKTLPEQFDRDSHDVLIEQIDKKYANKVILEVGLCVAFYDFLDVQDAYVYPAEGSCHQVVRFRLIVYRPFVGEVLQGEVAHSDADGIRVSMGFFEDILVPARSLRQPASFNPTKAQWTWHYHGEQGEDDEDFPIVVGGSVRFKVTDCIFTLVTRSMRERRVTSSTSSASTMLSELGVGGGGAGGVLGLGRGGGFFGVPDHRGAVKDEGGVPAAMAGMTGVTRQRSASNVGFAEDGGKGSAAPEQPSMQIVGDIGSDDGLGMLEWW